MSARLSSLKATNGEPNTWSLGSVVDAICDANGDFPPNRHGQIGQRVLPSRDAVARIMSGLRAALFPWHFGAPDVSEQGLAFYVGRTLDSSLAALQEQV